MPTIFERLDSALQGNDLAVHITVQSGNLGAVANLVAGLINNPPNSLGDLSAAINELPLPDLGIDASFVAKLGQLRAAVPTDLAAVTGVLTTGLQTVSATIDSEITGPLDSVLKAINAIYALTQIDFTCGAPGAPGIGLGPLSLPFGDLTNGALVLGAPGEPSLLAQSTALLNDALTLLNGAPTDVESFLAWFSDIAAIFSQEQGFALAIPVLHEWLDPLQTLQTWKNMQPDEIRDHIGLTLQALSAFVQSTAPASLSSLTTALTATVAQLHSAELATIATELTAGLAQLKTAVMSGNLSSTGPAVAQLNLRLDEYDPLRTAMQPSLLTALPGLASRLDALSDDLVEQMCHLHAVLQPNTSLSILQHLPAGLLQNEGPAAAVIQAQLQPMADWLQRLADQLDLSIIQEPLQTVGNSVQSAVDELDQALATVALQVRALFAQVEALVDEVDTQALAAGVQAAIHDFATELTNQLEALFQPLQDAISAIIESISNGVDSFNPADIVVALQDATQKVTAVLKDPAVTSALTEIRNAVNTVAGQLEELSFAPLTDQVIAAIEEITTALQAIDPSTLNVALQGALTAALAVLPADLTPVTDPFIADFGLLVESGAVPLLATVQAQPQRLLDRVRQFEPGTLLGNALSQPFQQLITQMEAFQPSALLAPVEQELDKLKDRLRTIANPAAPLALLEEPFNQLLQSFDALSPDGVVKPLEDAISGVVNQIVQVLPVDEIFAQVDAALNTVNEVVTFARTLAEIVNKVHDLLAGFTNAQEQVESWIAAILDKVAAINDTAPLQPGFAGVVAALDETKASALVTRFAGAAGPLLAALAELNPQAKLTALVQTFSTFPTTALAALADSPEKAALSAALARIKPLDPGFSVPYQALANYQQKLTQAQTTLQSTLTGWDLRYHSEDGLLASFRRTGATAVELRQWVQEALEPQFIQPTRLLFRVLEPAVEPLAAFAGLFDEMVTTLQNKVDELLLGPGALGGIRNNLQILVQRLQAFNLNFLRESINAVFAQVRGKVEAIGPAQLKAVIEAAFDAMLDTITLAQILPPDIVTTLSADYAAVITKLKALDPGKLVIEVIQPEFKSKIIPFLDAFDLSVLFTALLDRLRALDEELRAEMARVNAAYQEMRAAVPSLSLSVDIDIDIGF